jgi:signal peptidase II
LSTEKKQNPREQAVSLIALAVIAAVIFGLDQWTKAFVKASLVQGEWWAPIPSAWRLFRFTHTTNTGAAFGIFPNQGGFFVVIAIVVVVAIVLYYRNLPAGSWVVRVALGLQLGGAMGNLFDRLRFGYVTDFIDVGFWPVFNIADSSIVIGVALIAYSLWKDDLHRDPQKSATMDAEVGR